jgi:hypothetical protein
VAGGLASVLAYLARETLGYWRVQASARRITTPSPAAVRWRWAGDDLGVPALRPTTDDGDGVLLGEGPGGCC